MGAERALISFPHGPQAGLIPCVLPLASLVKLRSLRAGGSFCLTCLLLPQDTLFGLVLVFEFYNLSAPKLYPSSTVLLHPLEQTFPSHPGIWPSFPLPNAPPTVGLCWALLWPLLLEFFSSPGCSSPAHAGPGLRKPTGPSQTDRTSLFLAAESLL